jgi:prolyl oligopeptidase
MRVFPLLVALSLLACAKAVPPVTPVAPAPAAPATAPLPPLPEARTVDASDTFHGVVVPDPWRWLEDETAPEVQAWMKAEDAHTRARLATVPVRERLEKRFTELYYVDSVSAPVQRGNRFFYMRTHADREKAILYWREGSDGPEKVLLDPNTWGDGKTISLGEWTPSWDGSKLVYQEKPNAADEATLKVIDVATGQLSATDTIPGGKYADPDWTPDGKAFYYEFLPSDPSIKVDERPGYTELRYHVLGTDPAKDTLVHPATKDPKTFLVGSLSRDGRWLAVYIQRGWNENDVYLRDLSDPKGAFKPFVLGKDATYAVGAWKDALYVQTNEGAPQGRIFKVDPKRPARKDWKELVAEDKGAVLQGFSIVGGHVALTYLKDVSSEVRIHTLDGKPVRTVALPGLGTVSGIGGLEDVDTGYFTFTNHTTPRQVYRTTISTGASELWAKVEVKADLSQFTVEQVRYASKDGTQIPMFLVHKKDLPRDGKRPTLLYGYGGFDVSLTPSYSSRIVPWLEAGGVYAIANLRGGGEYGQAWHDAGRGANKQNVFDDFAAAGEYLVREGWTNSRRLAVNGGSNGGLLMGAAITQRPDLWGAVVCGVPLLDMVRYHMFGSGRTWIPEYGSSEDPEQFKTLLAYSPYHRVKPGTPYPAFLMMASDHDDRVDPMHARKFVAALRANDATPGDTLLRVEANAGHGGADQVGKAIQASADMYAFLWDALDIE